MILKGISRMKGMNGMEMIWYNWTSAPRMDGFMNAMDYIQCTTIQICEINLAIFLEILKNKNF